MGYRVFLHPAIYILAWKPCPPRLTISSRQQVRVHGLAMVKDAEAAETRSHALKLAVEQRNEVSGQEDGVRVIRGVFIVLALTFTTRNFSIKSIARTSVLPDPVRATR